MTQIKKTIAGLAFAAGCVIILTGCEKDKVLSGFAKNVGVIRVTANSSNLTKAVATTKTALESSNGFVLDVWTNDAWYDLYSDPADRTTFGLPIETSKQEAGQYINSNGVANVKYSDVGHTYTSNFRTGSQTTSGWYIVDPTETDPTKYYEPYNWITGPTSDDEYKFYLRFWARYPQNSEIHGSLSVTPPAINADTETFTYTLPTASAGSDATNQEDLLFAYTEVNQDHSRADDAPYATGDFPVPASTTVVNLNFNHPLSMINFCVSPDDGTYDVHLKIKRITITNVPGKGKCDFYGKGTIALGTMFRWYDWSSYASYSQDYNAMFDVPPTGWTASSYGSAGKHIYTCQNAFMLIPHTPKYVSGGSDNAKITIVFEDTFLHDGDVERTIELNPGGTDVWKPGYYYTYKICATKIGRDVTTSVYLTDWTNPSSTTNIY